MTPVYNATLYPTLLHVDNKCMHKYTYAWVSQQMASFCFLHCISVSSRGKKIWVEGYCTVQMVYSTYSNQHIHMYICDTVCIAVCCSMNQIAIAQSYEGHRKDIIETIYCMMIYCIVLSWRTQLMVLTKIVKGYSHHQFDWSCLVHRNTIAF